MAWVILLVRGRREGGKVVMAGPSPWPDRPGCPFPAREKSDIPGLRRNPWRSATRTAGRFTRFGNDLEMEFLAHGHDDLHQGGVADAQIINEFFVDLERRDRKGLQGAEG